MSHHRFTVLLLPGILMLVTAFIQGQSVYLSEATSANTTYYDEDGSLADWLELHNPGDRPVDLGGYGLTDDPDQPRKWTFTSGTTLAAGEYLQLWASGKDRPTESYPRALLTSGDEVRYVLPDAEVDRDTWVAPDYDDAAWLVGATPLGYGSGGEGNAAAGGHPRGLPTRPLYGR